MEAEGLGRESLGAGQLFLEFAEAEIGKDESGAQKSEALVVSDRPSCRGFGRMDV